MVDYFPVRPCDIVSPFVLMPFILCLDWPLCTSITSPSYSAMLNASFCSLSSFCHCSSVTAHACSEVSHDSWLALNTTCNDHSNCMKLSSNANVTQCNTGSGNMTLIVCVKFLQPSFLEVSGILLMELALLFVPSQGRTTPCHPVQLKKKKGHHYKVCFKQKQAPSVISRLWCEF